MKNIFFWILAFAITLGAAFYQRATGPTNPKKTSVMINGVSSEQKLKRSQTNTRPCKIDLTLPEDIKGTIFYRRFPSEAPWSSVTMERSDMHLTGVLPSQPAAGKLQYYIVLNDADGSAIPVMKDNPVVIRFKGNVPAIIMIPHIIIMFIAMLLSNLSGLFGAFGKAGYKRYGVITLMLLLAGGMILGPLVQYYAFGELWTGIPFGWDLTDNKTLVAIMFWIIAVVMNRRKESRAWTVIAALILLLIYSIPHSLFGSQLNYESGEVTQGLITLFLTL